MTLFGNNFDEGIKDRQNDGRYRPIKNGFRQLAKADFWLPGHNERLKERLKGYNTEIGSVSSGHMEISELIIVCTDLKNKLQSISDDCLAIRQSCTENQDAFEEVRLGYSSTIEYLSEQTFIRNSARIFEENQQDTDQEILKLIGIFDDLMTSIISLTEHINDIDVVEIDRMTEWLRNHP